MSDLVAKSFTKFFRLFADLFFRERYGHRAVVLETIAGVPGMVAGMWIHLKSLRTMDNRYDDMIKELLSEAENERMHLMFFIEIAKPTLLERMLILLAQGIFWHFYFIMYVFFPKTSHKMIAYFEEEAVRSYTSYLELLENGQIEDVPAPKLAIEYYYLNKDSKLSDMIKSVRNDEQKHANVNHNLSSMIGII
jgi:ubiquinol oxidase